MGKTHAQTHTSITRLQGPPQKNHLQSEDQPQPAPAEPRSPIYSLNDDVLYYLATSILPLQDAAALALTSTATFRAMGGRKILKEIQSQPIISRVDFLQRLELDFPDHVLCYRCATFHSRLSEDPWTQVRQKSECDFESDSMEFHPDMFCLPYRHAREIANHYRLGPRYGRSEGKLLPHYPYVDSRPQSDTTAVHHLDFKCIDKGVDFNLILRRSTQVEYNFTIPKSRTEARFSALGHTVHIWDEFEENDLAEELLPSCYRCGWCGAERQFSITYLRNKPEYAVFRSTLWESVGHCKNTDSDLWKHICSPLNRRVNYTPIRQSELMYEREFIDEMPDIPSKGFHDSSFRKLVPQSQHTAF
ncbi:hypothetical protein FQN49_008661 [Arthroderma sp. PD_2]|nr:hypothetical protein FQN49_008661 [Arthroderma sp. PD_2]